MAERDAQAKMWPPPPPPPPPAPDKHLIGQIEKSGRPDRKKRS